MKNYPARMNKKLYSRWLLGVCGVVSCIIAASLIADAGKFSVVAADVIYRFESHQTVDVMVYLKERADLSSLNRAASMNDKRRRIYSLLSEAARQSQGRLIAWLNANQLQFRPFYIVNAVAVRGVSYAQLSTLAERSDINKITLDANFQIRQPNLEGSLADPINPKEIPNSLKIIGVDKVWNEFGIKGKGIVVAGQDTGYLWTHQALINQYRGSQNGKVDHQYNWHDAIHAPLRTDDPRANPCGYELQAPCDDDSHGTHTMGTIVGYDGNQERIGVAPDSQWIGCRNMDRGTGKPSTYFECFEYFLAPYPTGGNPQTDGQPEMAPHVINNSWGCPTSEGCKGEELLPIIQILHQAGIMVVAAAGNDGPSCGTTTSPPAFYGGDVLSVAAYNVTSDNIAGFSSRGPSSWNGTLGLNITAPGTPIRSSVPGGGNNQYGSKGGTSMASPHVAGVVALIWSAQPSLVGKITETVQLIESTAQAKKSTQTCGAFNGQNIPNATFGYGLIDAYAAVKASLSLSY